MLALIAEMPWTHFVADSGWCVLVPPRGNASTGGAPVSDIRLPLRIGSRTVGEFRRRLVQRPFSLTEAMSSRLANLPALPDNAQGFLVTSLPIGLAERMIAAQPALVPFVWQSYRRHFAALGGSYEQWLTGLSARSRSTLKRKVRRFAMENGGDIDLRCYRRPDEMAEFHRLGRSVSALTYQERRLGRGLPAGPEFLAQLQRGAERKAALGWILMLRGRPVSYLYAPADGDVLIYDRLGYDPDFAELSPGTVLQAGVMRQLYQEKNFRYLDFTEGEGRHKEFFATGDIACADLLLLRRTPANLFTGHALRTFDATVAAAKHVTAVLGLEALARKASK